MSAIWGAIDFSGKEIDEKIKEIFRKVYSECVIDRTEEISVPGVYLGCGIQYITPESIGEKLPCATEDFFFTADVILDNRDELCKNLGIENSPDIPDGEILKNIYIKYGKTALNMLLGAYTFVMYNTVSRRVEIVSDAAGNRYVYHILIGNVLYFSSLMKPLEEIIPVRKLNERWTSDFLACDGLSVFETSEDTPIKGIDRIAPATYISYEKGILSEKYLYWDVDSIRSGKKTKTDDEYKAEFRELYKRCVRDILRANGETAIFLSGGFDSTSVACLAAPILKERGKKLYSFTSVPLGEYVSDRPEYMETDESNTVKKTAEFLGNVEPSYLKLEGVNLWDARKEYMKVCEIPYKSTQNVIWLYEGYRQAARKGARIILSGAFGNGTVSYDNSYQYLCNLVKTFRFKTFLSEINGMQRNFGISRKKTIIKVVSGIFGGNREPVSEKPYEKSYICKDYLIKSGAPKRIKYKDKVSSRAYTNPHLFHREFLSNSNFRHYSEFPQKNSLYSGVVLRDPTRDKRMVEFVKSIPYDQFFTKGYTRRLIRQYMSDLMPKGYFVRHPFGVQSADTKLRYELFQESIMKEWKEILNRAEGKGIVDTEAMKDFVEKKTISEMEFFDVYRLFYSINLLEYIKDCEL